MTHSVQIDSHARQVSSQTRWLFPAGMFWSCGIGLATAAGPTAGLAVAFAPPLLYFVFNSPTFRLFLTVAGGLLVFGSSGGVGVAKLAYFALLLLIALVGALNLALDTPTYAGRFIPLLPIGIVLVVAVFLSVLTDPGVPVTATVRQGLFYLMIPLAPIVGLDAGRKLDERKFQIVLGALGMVASISYCMDWLGRRGVSSQSSGKIIASSFVLPSFVWALSIAKVIGPGRVRNRAAWLVPLLVIPIALILPGTRTNLVVFAAPLAMLGRRSRRAIPPLRFLALVLTMLVAVVILVPIFAKLFISDPTFLSTRIRMLLGVLHGGATHDQSGTLRLQQYDFAWNHIRASPWFGMGPGYASDMTLDTPLTVILRVGFIGTSLIVLFLASVLVCMARMASATGGSEYSVAARGVALVIVCLIPFGTVVEDRGFAMMIMLALAGAVSTRVPSRHRQRTTVRLQ